jgi:hypothetical protein
VIAPAECQGCGHLCSGTSGGHRHDACANNNNRSKFTSAPICRAMGWHETPADLRASAVRDAIQRRDLLLRQIGFESPRRGECRALMLGVIDEAHRGARQGASGGADCSAAT